MTSEYLTTEEVIQKVHDLAAEARVLADAIRPIEAVAGEHWVSANGIADDLAQLEDNLWRETL